MSYTYKTRYSITTVITPPNTPSPPLSVATPSSSPGETSSYPNGGYGTGLATGSEPSWGATSAQIWWPNAPHPQRRRQAPLLTHSQQPYDSRPAKRTRVSLDDPVAINNEGSGERVEDLLQRLISSGLLQVPKTETNRAQPLKPVVDNAIIPVDLNDLQSLRTAQPGLVTQLYSGTQCSGCSTRFPVEQTALYSQHLDWHFRQNRRERTAKLQAQSRPWYYARSDWMQSEEVEDLDRKEKNWFETNGAKKAGKEPEVMSGVIAGAIGDDNCALCGDKFEMFYDDDDDEWHLKNSVRYEAKNYHPLCLEDVKKRVGAT